MVPKVLPADLVCLYLFECAPQCANEGAIILDGEGPAIEKSKAIGAQAQDIIGRVRPVMGSPERPDMSGLSICASG